MDFFAGLVALAYFVMISAATRQHFTSEKYPLGMYLISGLSLIGLFVFLLLAFYGNLMFSFAALVLMVPAFALFLWATRHSRKKLSLAFDNETKGDGIITSGPWKYIRHPFYSSYIIFWLACAIGTAHPASIAVFGTLLFVYLYSAKREEGFLSDGRFGQQYIDYQKNAGFLLPKIPSRN
ncbi:methyltransferase family protein [Pelagovum pacificum]|uniref:Isoprenylcysteine carboxylmethyltransferase family protein n=1 Tax=Pelagovum pacificum TaxID=2588711 RepID=A0A5C5GHR1_9RHOB|nr:isoprenylcysteine carboxylmethyltransferase family protein [Pelagovum pacificum]QQA43392.1 isoprenylcysteine carboxylmethyltransferase family protein [Pelagovum pacificum]TNY33469.1 isoprenylcysteine carboxylmethyltransferase family protein [Pelagovum pacificum]